MTSFRNWGFRVSLLLVIFTVSEVVWSEPECGAINKTDEVPRRYKTTLLLNALLEEGYNKKFHPGYFTPEGGRRPTVVDVNLNIRSMGPISETDMAYQMDCYFRQQWTDERLRFAGNETLRVSVNILERMWKPDTHFFNGQKSYLHTVTTPNKLLRIEPTGTVLYSMRITIKASCPMHLEKFPMDTQTCPLIFGSHGYSVEDVRYRWTHGPNRSIKMASDMTLSQFDLIAFPQGAENRSLPLGGSFSLLWADFIFRRHMGYFLINLYIPTSLLVVISWVGFWINREATSDRIALGIMTVLTMAFIGIDNRGDLPKVSYATALDYFISVSFLFVLATILEFASVHFFTKHGSGEYSVPLESDENVDDDDDEEENGDDVEAYDSYVYGVRREQTMYTDSRFYSTRHWDYTSTYIPNGDHHGNYSKQITNSAASQREHCCSKFYHCVTGSASYKDRKLRASQADDVNSVSQIDKASRVIFPLAFCVFHVLYWSFYLGHEASELLM